jgi:hypothetical protein
MRKSSLSFWITLVLATLSLGSGGFTVVRDLYFYSQSKEPPNRGLLTFLQVCSIFAAWGLWIQERWKLSQYEKQQREEQISSRPRIRIAQEGLRLGPIIAWLRLPSSSVVLSNYIALNLYLINDPITITDRSSAEDVCATLSFYAANGEKLCTAHGRWADSNAPTERGNRDITEILAVRFPPGLTRSLDIVLKYIDEDVCYIMNHESYQYIGFKNTNKQLPPGGMVCRVELKGSYINQIISFGFLNEGINGVLKVTSGPTSTEVRS